MLCPGFSDDRKEASRPKKTFQAADVRKMHDLLTKNMYKIRLKVRQQQQQQLVKIIMRPLTFFPRQWPTPANTTCPTTAEPERS